MRALHRVRGCRGGGVLRSSSGWRTSGQLSSQVTERAYEIGEQVNQGEIDMHRGLERAQIDMFCHFFSGTSLP